MYYFTLYINKTKSSVDSSFLLILVSFVWIQKKKKEKEGQCLHSFNP